VRDRGGPNSKILKESARQKRRRRMNVESPRENFQFAFSKGKQVVKAALGSGNADLLDMQETNEKVIN